MKGPEEPKFKSINVNDPFIGSVKQVGEVFRQNKSHKVLKDWNAVIKDNPNKDKDIVPNSNTG